MSRFNTENLRPMTIALVVAAFACLGLAACGELLQRVVLQRVDPGGHEHDGRSHSYNSDDPHDHHSRKHDSDDHHADEHDSRTEQGPSPSAGRSGGEMPAQQRRPGGRTERRRLPENRRSGVAHPTVPRGCDEVPLGHRRSVRGGLQEITSASLVWRSGLSERGRSPIRAPGLATAPRRRASGWWRSRSARG